MNLIKISILATLLLAGCATIQTPSDKAVSVPVNRVYFQSASAQPFSKITVIRDTGFQGGGVYVHFFLDEKRAASLDTGEKLTITVLPGQHTLGVHLTDPFGAEAVYSIDQNLISGNTYQYRILVDHNGARIQRAMLK